MLLVKIGGRSIHAVELEVTSHSLFLEAPWVGSLFLQKSFFGYSSWSEVRAIRGHWRNVCKAAAAELNAATVEEAEVCP